MLLKTMKLLLRLRTRNIYIPIMDTDIMTQVREIHTKGRQTNYIWIDGLEYPILEKYQGGC